MLFGVFLGKPSSDCGHEDLHLNPCLFLLCFQLGHADNMIIFQLPSEINQLLTIETLAVICFQ